MWACVCVSGPCGDRELMLSGYRGRGELWLNSMWEATQTYLRILAALTACASFIDNLRERTHFYCIEYYIGV